MADGEQVTSPCRGTDHLPLHDDGDSDDDDDDDNEVACLGTLMPDEAALPGWSRRGIPQRRLTE